MYEAVVKRSALLVATLASFLTPFMVSSINIALPAIGGEFKMSALLMGWVPTSYILAAAMFLVPFGRIADIYGRKRIFASGMWIFTITSFLLAFSTSATALITLRVLQGFGSSMIFGTGMAILTSVFPAEERGRVLGINIAAVYLGLSLGPVLGGFLTYQFGWRSIFLATGAARGKWTTRTSRSWWGRRWQSWRRWTWRLSPLSRGGSLETRASPTE